MNELPTELLIHILSLVNCRDLVTNCRLVCRKWKEVVDSVALRRKAEKTCSLKVLNAHSQGKHNEALHSWQIYYLMLNNVFARNLLKNNCGQNKMEFWRPPHSEDIGTKWKVEEFPEESDFLPKTEDFGDERCCFSPTSRYSSKYQIIRLKDFGLSQRIMDGIRPVFRIREWYYLSEKGGRINQAKVQLLDKRRCVIDSFSLEISEKISPGVWQSIEHELQASRRGVRFIKFVHSASVGCKVGGGRVEALVPPHTRKEVTARLCRPAHYHSDDDDCYETDSDADFKFDVKYEFYRYIKNNSHSEKELLTDYSKYRIKCDRSMRATDPFYEFYQSRIKSWRSHCNKGTLSSPEVRLATSRFKELLQKYRCHGDGFDPSALAQMDGSLEHDLDQSYQLFMSSRAANSTGDNFCPRSIYYNYFTKPTRRRSALCCNDDSCNHVFAFDSSNHVVGLDSSSHVVAPTWHCHRLCCHYFDNDVEKDADALLCKYVLLRHFGRKYYRKHHKRA